MSSWNLKALFPGNQKNVHAHFNTHAVLQINSPPSGLLNNGSQWTVGIRRGDIRKCKRVWFRFSVQVNGGNATLAPSSLWFRSIGVKQAINQTPIVTYRDLPLLFNNLALTSDNQRATAFSLINLNKQETQPTYSNEHVSGETKDYYVELNGSFFELLHANLADAQSDFQIEFTPNSSVVVNGAGTPTVSAMFLHYETEISPDNGAKDLAVQRGSPIATRFLEPIQVGSTPLLTTTSGGSKLSLDLKDISAGKAVSHILLTVCPTGTQPKDFLRKCINVGDGNGSTLDIQDSVGNSLYGMGSAVSTGLLRSHNYLHHFNNDFMGNVPIYCIPFSDSLPASYQGSASGYWVSDGASNKLVVNTALRVSDVQTFTVVNANVAGTYRLQFRGEQSARLAYNANVGAIKLALENMKSISRLGATVTVTGTFAASGNVVVTLDCAQGNCEGDVLSMVPFGIANAGGIFEQSSDAVVTTVGKAGLPAGSANYDVYVYAFVFKNAIYQNGKFSSAYCSGFDLQ